MITTESNVIHNKQMCDIITSNLQNENIKPLSGISNLRKIQTTILNQMLSHRKGETTCDEKNTKSRLRKSFLYTKPRFSKQGFDKLLIEQHSRRSKSKTKLIAEKLLNDISLQTSKNATALNDVSINPITNTNIIQVSKQQKESNNDDIIVDTFDLDKTKANNSNTCSKNDKTFSINNVDVSDVEPPSSSHIKEQNNTCVNIILPSSLSQNDIQNHINNTVINASPSKQNKFLNIPLPQHKKESSSCSFEETSNEDNSSTKECRKIEINPYRNVNTVKKYFVYQIKKYYLNSITSTTTTPHHHCQISSPNNLISSLQNASYHEIFTNYSNICSTPGNIYKRYDDQNMQINQYYIYKNQLIGKGYHSYVYICQDINTSTLYAVKIKHKKYMNNEIQLLKRVNSKYIVTVYEIITIKNECYIIMELMQNNSLNVNLLELDIFCIWKYFRNLISAVEHCHEIGKIIHHNISLRNCLINDDDVLKLSNFSCGLIINEEDNNTIHLNETAITQLTVVPPPEECFLIGEGDVDGRAVDIWLMGNVLYSLVMRKSFISSQSDTLTIDDYAIEGKIKCDNKQLEKLLMCILEPNPDKRYTMDEIKKSKWVTKDNEFPMPDVYEEALEYCYRITSKQIYEKDINSHNKKCI